MLCFCSCENKNDILDANTSIIVGRDVNLHSFSDPQQSNSNSDVESDCRNNPGRSTLNKSYTNFVPLTSNNTLYNTENEGSEESEPFQDSGSEYRNSESADSEQSRCSLEAKPTENGQGEIRNVAGVVSKRPVSIGPACN